MNALTTSQSITMNSVEFLENVINPARVKEGQSEVRYNDFIAKVKDELDCTHDELFAMKSTGGRSRQAVNLDYDKMILVGMRESKAVRKSVLLKLKGMNDSKPKELSRKDLAIMIIQAEEEKEQAMIEVDRLQGVCNTITAQFATGMTATKFCKTLNGVNTQQVNNTLIEMGKLRRTENGIVPVAYTRDRYFKEVQEEHNGKLRCHSALTLIGAKWLYRAYLSGKLPMKANWDNVNSHVVF